MKPFYALKPRFSVYFFLSIFMTLSSFHAKAQVYATSQTNSINGICLLCAIENPNNAISSDLTDYSQFAMTLGLLGVTESQTLIFPSTVTGGSDSLIIRIGSGNTILSLDLFGGVSVQTANGSTLNNDAQFIGVPILRLLNGNTLAEVVLKPTQSFDRVTLTLNSDLLGLLNSLRIYYALRKPVLPSAPVITILPPNATIHAGDSAVLYATAAPGSIIHWYNALTGGTLLSTGNSFTVHPTITTTYYAEASIGNALSVRVPVTITVLPAIIVPAPTVSPTSASIHLGDSVSLHASGGAGATITWYSALTGGTLLFTGGIFPVHPTITTTYYAEASIGNRHSVRTPIVITVTPAVVVSAPTVSPTSASIHLGDSVTLHASGVAGSIITWYSALTGGALLFTGGIFPVHPTITTTYYAEASIGNIHSVRTPIVITVTPAVVVSAPTVSPTSASIHLGDSVTLHASGVAGSSITWYSALTGGALLFTGGIFSVHPTITTTYYAEASIGNIHSVRTPIVITVTPAIVVSAPTVSPTSASIHLGDSVTLHASGVAGSIITWYSALTGGALLFTGGIFPVHPTITTTYYAEASIGNIHSVRTPIVITVTPAVVVSAPNVSPTSASIHLGDSVTLHASGVAGSIITWFSALTGGTLLFTGGIFPVHPTITTTYYAEASIGNIHSVRTPIVVTVTPAVVVSAPTVSPTSASIHLGDSVSLHASGVAGSIITWYSALTGGTLLFTGGIFPVHPTITTTYYAEASIGNIHSVRTPIVITVTPAIVVSAPTVSPTSASIHLGDSVSLHASGVAGSIITWYSALTGGALLFTGGIFPVHPTITTTYYAEASIGNIHSVRTPIVITVTPAVVVSAPNVSPTSASIHLGESVSLHASGAAGSTITWYSALTGGTLLFTGNIYIVHPAITTTYYAEATIGAHFSIRTAVTITVLPALVLELVAQPASICSGSNALISLLNAQPQVRYQVRFLGGSTDTVVFLTASHNTYMATHITGNINASIEKATDTITNVTVTDILIESDLVTLKSGCPVPISDVTGLRTSGAPANLSDSVDKPGINRISISPNPTAGYIHLTGNQDLSGSTIVIYNMQGTELQRDVLHSNEFQIQTSMPAGIYIIRVFTINKQVLTSRVIVRR